MRDTVSCRTVMKGVGATLGATAFAHAMAPLTEWTLLSGQIAPSHAEHGKTVHGDEATEARAA